MVCNFMDVQLTMFLLAFSCHSCWFVCLLVSWLVCLLVGGTLLVSQFYSLPAAAAASVAVAVDGNIYKTYTQRRRKHFPCLDGRRLK